MLRLERDGLVWYRHLELQAQKDADMPRRCFEYNSRLMLYYGAAVLTTVLSTVAGGAAIAFAAAAARGDMPVPAIVGSR